MPAIGLRAPIKKRKTTPPAVTLQQPSSPVKSTSPRVSSKQPTTSVETNLPEVSFVNPPLDPNRDPQLGPNEDVEKHTTKKMRECGELQEKYHMKDKKDLWNKALGIVRATSTKLGYDYEKGDTFHLLFEQSPRKYVDFLDHAQYRYRKNPEFGFLTDNKLDRMTASILQEQMRNKIKRLDR